eukprot:6173491-Pleurochrysis_carterae.AAC.3
MHDSCAAGNEWRDLVHRAALTVRLLSGYPSTALPLRPRGLYPAPPPPSQDPSRSRSPCR